MKIYESQKKKTPSFDLHIGDTKIKQVQHFKYLRMVLTEDGRCDTELQRFDGIAKIYVSKAKHSINENQNIYLIIM